MNRKMLFATASALLIYFVLGLIPDFPLPRLNWAISSLAVAVLALGFLFCSAQRNLKGVKELALVATLAALAAVLRVPFAVVPGLQPTTFLVMMTGLVFGAPAGFASGALAAFISNCFLGQGPWTPWQMLAWGLCGITASILPSRASKFNSRLFTPLAFFLGLLFGLILNLWNWLAFVYPLNWKTFLAVWAASIPFDLVHAAGNAAFALVLGQPFYRVLTEYRQRMTGIPLIENRSVSHNQDKQEDRPG